jgi:hypothetical protein
VPTLFLIVGLPGAGKTTRARQLATDHLGGASRGCWGVAASLKVLNGQMGLVGQWLAGAAPDSGR